eukprot:3932755-Rhodomonas_salina.1
MWTLTSGSRRSSRSTARGRRRKTSSGARNRLVLHSLLSCGLASRAWSRGHMVTWLAEGGQVHTGAAHCSPRVLLVGCQRCATPVSDGTELRMMIRSFCSTELAYAATLSPRY